MIHLNSQNALHFLLAVRVVIFLGGIYLTRMLVMFSVWRVPASTTSPSPPSLLPPFISVITNVRMTYGLG